MDSISGTASEEATSRFQASCPYIGMVSDPQTHVGIPDSRNYCHLVNPAREVSIGHQQGFCLGQQFGNCPVYKSSGDDENPEGVFEDGERAGRGFGLFRFGRRSKRDKPGAADVIPPVAAAASTAAIAGASQTIPEPVRPVSVHAPIPSPAQQAVPQPVSETVSLPESAPPTGAPSSPVDDEEELRMRLYNEALTRYEQVNNPKKERKGFWIFLMIAALFVLVISMWGIYTRSQNLLRQSQVEAEIGYTRSLATAVQDMGAASDAWGTAASIIDGRSQTATSIVLGSETSLQAGLSLEETARAGTAIALTATPISEVGICQSLGDASFQIISGPTLSPSESTLYQPGLQTPQATWVVKNTGKCGWSQLLFWSVIDNSITQPILKRNGQIVILSALSDQGLIAPGEQIELILQFPASQAQRVYGEWVLVADGLSLLSQPHLLMKVDNWITLDQYKRPTSTRLVKNTPGSGGGSEPGSGPGEQPPTREAPTPVPGGRP